jgi:hypothetical protein
VLRSEQEGGQLKAIDSNKPPKLMRGMMGIQPVQDSCEMLISLAIDNENSSEVKRHCQALETVSAALN